MDSVWVVCGGDTLKNPFAGGLNAPQICRSDLNGDHIPDLHIVDRADYYPFRWINAGIADSLSYTFDPEWYQSMPRLRYYAFLVDFNHDSLPDLFTANLDKMRVYRNTGVPGIPVFTLEKNILQTGSGASAVPMYIAQTDIPAVLDVDYDGDIDILAFSSSGLYVQWYRNMSIENNGHDDSLEFVVGDACWGKFYENGTTNDVFTGISCKGNMVSAPSDPVHSGSTVCLFDIERDSAYDVLLGDISYSNIVYVHNGGTPTSAAMDFSSNGFPGYGPRNALMDVFPAGFWFDANNDGRNDLIFAPSVSNAAINYGNVWWYENQTGVSQDSFVFRNTHFLQSQMIDLGAFSAPAVADVDADGRMDILAGYYRKEGPSTEQWSIAWYRNIGTPMNPVFELVSDDLLGIAATFPTLVRQPVPAAGDIDNDGDIDLIVGFDDGKIAFYENTAGSGLPWNLSWVSSNWMGIDAGNHASPAIGDVDRDGKPDLLIGNSLGNVLYFQNIGTSSIPSFPSFPTIPLLGGIDTDPVCCGGYAAPFLLRSPGGPTEILVGTEKGPVHRYSNIDGNISGTFTLTDTAFGNIRIGGRTHICAADINGNGRVAYITGNVRGGISIWEGTVSVGLGNSTIPEIGIWPNPSAAAFTWASATSLTGRLSVLDMAGREYLSQEINMSVHGSVFLPGLPAGVYMVRFELPGKGVWVEKWVNAE